MSLLCLLLLFCVQAKAIQSKTDSLRALLATAAEDTNKVNTMLDLAFALRTSDPDEGLKLSKEGIELAKKLQWKPGIGKGYNTMGSNLKARSEYPAALEAYQQALTIFEEQGRKKDLALILMNLGSVYRPLGEYDKALEYYSKAIKYSEEAGTKKTTGQLLGNMGVVYFQQGRLEEQLDVNARALKIFREIGDQGLEAWILANTGDTYAVKEDFATAMKYQREALVLHEKMGNLSYKGSSYDNIGMYFGSMAQKSKDENEKRMLLDSSIVYFERAGAIFKELNDLDYLKDVYFNISDSRFALGDYRSAYTFYKSFAEIKDSIHSVEAKESITKLETKRELELRDKEIQIESLKKRTELLYMSAGGAVLLLIMAFTAVGYRRQKRSKDLISKQKLMVEEKQKEILDSISYAKYIQSAIMTNEKEIKNSFPESYLLYQPKDIVAGDFYFFERNSTHIFYAVADCTGHGVPGALVSVVCANALSRCVKEFGLTEPGAILDKAKELVVATFKSANELRDGMDVSLLVKDLRSNTYKWAGANNGLWIFRQGKLTEIKPTKQPVGFSERVQPFTTHELQLEKNDLVVLFTDGYADQFGGAQGKKFKYKQLQQLIAENSGKGMNEHKTNLEQNLKAWKGQLEQVDDVCIAAIRI